MTNLSNIHILHFQKLIPYFKVRYDIVKPIGSGEEVFYKQPELTLSNNTKILKVKLTNPFSELEQLLKTLGEVESNIGVINLE